MIQKVSEKVSEKISEVYKAQSLKNSTRHSAQEYHSNKDNSHGSTTKEKSFAELLNKKMQQVNKLKMR